LNAADGGKASGVEGNVMKVFKQSFVTVKAESNFYAALEECPPRVLSETRGIDKYREEGATFLKISGDILDPASIFYRYLATPPCRNVFGERNPLYSRAALAYERDQPIGINYFCTRLLLAFMEVQLALGFSGSNYERHKTALENRMRGEQPALTTNYYHPFTHEDNAGIHYVLNMDGRGGYAPQDWEHFMAYLESSVRVAFTISPVNFGDTPTGLENKLAEYREIISTPYLETGIIKMPAIRHLGILTYDVLYGKGSAADQMVPNPAGGESMRYIPLVDCLLDMPFRENSLIVFQSTCADK
jgi:hypothetical protein